MILTSERIAYRIKNLEKEKINYKRKNITSPGGLEPPTFRLTAERANRLRHGDVHVNKRSSF